MDDPELTADDEKDGPPPEPGMVQVEGADAEGNPTVDWVYPDDLSGDETPAEGGEPPPGGEGQLDVATAYRVLQSTPEGKALLDTIGAAERTRAEAVRKIEEDQRELQELVTQAEGSDAEKATEAKEKIAERAIASLKDRDTSEASQQDALASAYGQLFESAQLTQDERQRLLLKSFQGASDEDLLAEFTDVMVERRQAAGTKAQAEGQAAANELLAEKHTGAPKGKAPIAGSEEEAKLRKPVAAPGPATPAEPGAATPILAGQAINLDDSFRAAAEAFANQ